MPEELEPADFMSSQWLISQKNAEILTKDEPFSRGTVSIEICTTITTAKSKDDDL